MSDMGGPVSDALEAELRGELRRHGIVIWLDRDGCYTRFVDRLIRQRRAGTPFYEVAGFRGSHLALMLALAPHTGGVDRPCVLVHMPGFHEESVKQTPVLELHAAGVPFRKALPALVAEAAAGRVRPEDIAAFQAQEDITLEQADAWLAAMMAAPADAFAVQLQALPATALVDDLLAGGAVARRLATGSEPGIGADVDALWHRVSLLAGMHRSWPAASLPPGPVRGPDAAFVIASWALCVEYVHDLRRAPFEARLAGLRDLPGPLVDTCRALAAHLRAQHPGFYRRAAGETEGWLAAEVERAVAEDLGRIDTFRFEEDTILQAALAALAAQRWAAALDWAGARLAGGSFWLGEDPARAATWQLVADAARLGQAMAVAGPRLRPAGAPPLEGLAEAVQRYVQAGAAVDRAHRHLEQRQAALLDVSLPAFHLLRARIDALRALWRAWADAWARDFSDLCRRAGFVPDAGLQQRTLFDEVVRPLAGEDGCTAYFLIDAFRYEMAAELRDRLDEARLPATTVRLEGRLAELPTVTEVGMNALAPVAAGGRLRPALSAGRLAGFQAGEFRVNSPETRRRAMQDRVGGATCPRKTLAEVVDGDPASLRQTVARARLVIVHSTELDDAGENGMGTAAFDLIMQRLRTAWQLLREAGVRRFVMTADHGFLLLGEGAVRGEQRPQPHGRKVDPKRRHVLSPVAADHTGEVRVALADLGYEGAGGLHLMMPETANIFDTGGRGGGFVHGGNSLQERVIPVLTVVHRTAAGSDNLRYAVWAEAREGVAGMHCIEARVDIAAQGALDFGGRKEVYLALRVVDAGGVAVELCQARKDARLEGGAIRAAVGSRFEVFFRLTGTAEGRVRVALGPTSAAEDMDPATIDARFAVTVPRAAVERAGAPDTGRGWPDRAWLDELPAGGVRQLFDHLAAHGSVTEDEAARMLGSARALRRFSAHFEDHVRRAPFAVRIESVAGIKRYVREGASR